MFPVNNPFPHEDGAPVSWQENKDMNTLQKEQERSYAQATQYLKMLNSIMK